ncbi:Type I phosphodiesterase / nucleotide pyrophosphatase [Bryocella elongata]|uniref:Type I phosphodiesterase / nucleotide pyrophosphatase n=1 Tax=Bryocella elongata TaxID=863522 RepID=A0A1H6BPL5_9BACT|nr:alkaline phosphatase family protein [Bryocella elongata]SEG62641.1 Type I phosphodiesterase / nucleotide pyrophosphatase [Bryocella elongata]
MSPLYASSRVASACLLASLFAAGAASAQSTEKSQARPHNVIIFVADGLRRNSVTPETMPAFYKLRSEGVDFQNSHSVFPTFTTANASAIATGHGLGDTGDYSNVIWPGTWLARPDAVTGAGFITPFLENDEILADMNAIFNGNYLGERTLLSVAREHGFHVASVGKLGPTAIQQNDSLAWDPTGFIDSKGAIVIDDATGTDAGLALPIDVQEAMEAAGLPTQAPTRSNGYPEGSKWNNGFSGDAKNPGTLQANFTQQQWMIDVTTKALLPMFTKAPSDPAEKEAPFVILFWSRDPDATQHNQGDSPLALTPGINGPTSALALKNADHCLGELLAWLDRHPAVKANTDVLVTSDHGFATISRREIDATGATTSAPAANLQDDVANPLAHDQEHMLPTGFLALDLGAQLGLHVFDAAKRSTTTASVYEQVPLTDKVHFPSSGSALLGDKVTRLDGQDAKILIATNGGSDLLYFPAGDTALIKDTVAVLASMDYVGGIFVDDKYCADPSVCAGALPMSAVGLVGHSNVPRPAIAVAFKHFYLEPGNLQSGIQLSDNALKEGQGMHGGLARDQTFNNMAAIGPDFRQHFADNAPFGNIDLVPTIAHILGIEMPSAGALKGRVATEALKEGKPAESKSAGEHKTLESTPTTEGLHTVLEYQELNGVKYYDQACLVAKDTHTCK